MKKIYLLPKLKNATLSVVILFSSYTGFTQTNVYDNVIATSSNHTSLLAAINTAGLQGALQNPMATLTVFAPDNAAFDDLATALGTDIAGLLASPDLTNILLYHVLGTTADAASITNGQIVQPLNPSNSIKLTKTSTNAVYANQAMVNAADLTADNGIVHSIDAVILSDETVVDIALGSAIHSYLVAAVVQEELLPALTNPFAEFTVFAPTNSAFDDLATALGTDIAGLLASPDLTNILLYHVLGITADAASITNGQIVQPLNPSNSIKLTKTSTNAVYANQAMVNAADLTADNGIVHSLDAVVLPRQTVVDVALGSIDHTYLVAALVQEELLPALTDPFAQFTVFAPTNTAFDALATELSTDIAGLLALPNLSDILLYHVASGQLLSGDLTNGTITMLNTGSVVIDLTSGVMVNTATVTAPDLTSDNGVVHVIDKVLIENTSAVETLASDLIEIFPNPSSDYITIKGTEGNFNSVVIIDAQGRKVVDTVLNENSTTIDVQHLNNGFYTITFEGSNEIVSRRFLISSNK